ncbi:MAG TPA: hypothetical protein VJB87_03055 [Candidatus Nanoarchaeia archaeon]|nr:hypothetical protein [Candidatus Nanoarchaeia archaeon]
MTYHPLKFDLTLGESIGRYIKKAAGTAKKFAQEHAQQLGFRSTESCYKYVSFLRQGYLLGSLRPQEQTARAQQRLSITLHLANVPLQSNLIERIRELEQQFIYPPTVTSITPLASTTRKKHSPRVTRHQEDLETAMDN